MTDQYHLQLEQKIKELEEQIIKLEAQLAYLRFSAGEAWEDVRALNEKLAQYESATPNHYVLADPKPEPKMGFIY